MGDPFEELKELRQNGSVEDYITEFELFWSKCGRLLEAQYLVYFIGRLKMEIRSLIHTFKPQMRYQALKLARDIEVEFVTWFQKAD